MPVPTGGLALGESGLQPDEPNPPPAPATARPACCKSTVSVLQNVYMQISSSAGIMFSTMEQVGVR